MRHNHSQLEQSRSGSWRRVTPSTRALTLAVLLVAPQAMAADKPSGPDTALRVLPAGVEKAVESAFQRAAPAWTLKTAKVDKISVAATVCSQAGACHDLVLSDPTIACKGAKVGPWCLTWSGAAPSDPAGLTTALAKDADATMWRTIPARPKQPEIMEPIAAAAGATAATAAGVGGGDGEGGHGGKGERSGDDGADDGADDGDNTILLILALVAAAGATFVLFRRGDDDDEDQGAAPEA